jgi:hypothetical protein
LILVRESDEHLGMNQLIEQHLTDSRRGKNTQLRVDRPQTGQVLWFGEQLRLERPSPRSQGRAAVPNLFRTDQPEGGVHRHPFGIIHILVTRQPAGADREGRSHRFTPGGGAGYRQYRDPGLWSAGEQRIQRTLRVHLLSPGSGRGTARLVWALVMFPATRCAKLGRNRADWCILSKVGGPKRESRVNRICKKRMQLHEAHSPFPYFSRNRPPIDGA